MNSEIYWIQDLSQGRLGTMAHPQGGGSLEPEVQEWKRAGISVIASALTIDEMTGLGLLEEPKLCEKYGVEFAHFPVLDRSVPHSLVEWTRFIERLRSSMLDQKAIVAHCRMGIGRSSMIALSILVAHGHSLDKALEFMILARRRPIPDTSEQLEWIAEFAKSLKGEL